MRRSLMSAQPRAEWGEVVSLALADGHRLERADQPGRALSESEALGTPAHLIEMVETRPSGASS